MPSRQDATAKRLLKLLEDARPINSQQVTDAVLGPLSEVFNTLMLPNLDDPLVHATLTRSALMLDKSHQQDALILRAFEAAGLDPRNPLNWRQLLGYFAEAHFGKKTTKPVKWDQYELMVVLKDYLEVKRNHQKLKDSEICNLLMRKKPYSDKYGKYNFHALRKLARHARSPKYNLYLRHPEMRDPLLQLVRDHFERLGMPWDEALGKQHAEALKLAAEEMPPSKHEGR
jgi:hypothetical protein